MELGARRMDFIGLKFQLADEMAAGYARALAASTSTDRKTRATVSRELSDLNGVNGRIQDLRNGYTLMRDLYESAWLRSNRPYWLRNILEQYDYATQLWLARADKVHSAQRQWTESKTLPTAEELGIPPAPPAPRLPLQLQRPRRRCSGDCAMTTTLLTARRLITADGIVENPRIAIHADGTIASIESGEGTSQAQPGAEETTLTPAFFDIHVHGAAGHDAMEGSPEALGRIGSFLATKGVAYFLATTVTAPIDRTLRALEGIANAIDAANLRPTARDAEFAAQPVGIHLEGPFLSHAKRGVHPAADIQPPSIPLFERMQQAARGHIRLLTIAPETPGALDLIAYATHSGTRVSLGHSDATAAQTRAAIAAGAASATHTFNAMRRLDHREPGIAGVVLDARVALRGADLRRHPRRAGVRPPVAARQGRGPRNPGHRRHLRHRHARRELHARRA